MNLAASAPRRVLLLHSCQEEAVAITALLKQGGFEVIYNQAANPSADEFLDAPPIAILVAEGAGGRSIETLASDLKADPFLGRLPLIVLIREVRVDNVDWETLAVDDYVVVPYRPAELLRRLHLCVSRMANSLDANPLTRLPGNTSILHELTRRIERGKPYAVAYLDIDLFKSFNDRYGYARGDEALIVTSRLVTTVVHELAGNDGFVGHVGGDDFVFISDPITMDDICKTIIKRFDLVIPDFYDPEDRAKGKIQSIDRRGIPQEFPLMTLSIAVISSETGLIKHPGDVSKAVCELKKVAKTMPGSTYVKERRKT